MLEDKYISDALKSITSTSNYPRLMTSLFSRPVDSHKDFSYDFNSNISFDPYLSLFSTHLQNHATRVFLRHGAVHIPSPLLMPKNSRIHVPESPKQPVYMLDTSGEIVQLPWDLTVPFARFISRAMKNNPHVKVVKRFAIDPVYRRNLVGGQPKAVLECDFDIVTRSQTDMAPEAEGESLFWGDVGFYVVGHEK
jgi:translation initiation factor 2-alpha kinase 4